MFDSKHYVPILKWKPAEQQALEKLDSTRKKFITPLIQFLLPNPSNRKGQKEKTVDEQHEESVAKFRSKIQQVPSEILKYWGSSPIFIDPNLLIDKPLQEESFVGFLEGGSLVGVHLVPVIGLNTDKSLINVVIPLAKKYNTGLCLRLFRSDLATPGLLNTNIRKLLDEYKLEEKQVDLLIDFQITNNDCLTLPAVASEIPDIKIWRTFIFASGAFPVDLTSCEVGLNYLPRLDWQYWVKQIRSTSLERNPTFGDYAMQHPIYKSHLHFFSPSASIRYSLKENWLIMRGQKGKNEQYLANAQLLSGLPEFFGEKFSEGDAFIVEKGKDLKSKKTGNATSWLKAGINHHLACTADQIASLF